MKRLLTFFLLLLACNLHATDFIKCGSGWWTTHKQNYGMEKVSVAFPTRPTVSQDSTMRSAYAFDHQTCYNFTGYFPPIGNIHISAFFDDILNRMQKYPFELNSYTTYENTSGNWVLEYVGYDRYRHLTIRSFTVVTPFNAYTLQCIHPYGATEYYTYFRDNFRILCECDY